MSSSKFKDLETSFAKAERINIKPELFERIHKFNKNTKIIEDVIDQFQKESENYKPNNSVKIEDLLKDRCVSDASTYHLFKTPAELEKFRKIKLNTSLFMLRLGKSPLWMPNKFKLTKKMPDTNALFYAK